MSMILAGHPLLVCIHHLQLEQSCNYVRNENYIPSYYLTREKEGLGHEGPVL